MSDNLATYSFLPWLRRGIANKITGNASVGARATIPVKLKITGSGLTDNEVSKEIQQDIALYGPGDIVGIDKRNIVKNQPGKGITNFESNYLPYVEFYDEDFPWRYSPVSPASGRLQPWLMLVVLKDAEWEKPTQKGDRPLPFFNLLGDTQSVFPPAKQLWAWAHVHINESIINKNEEMVAVGNDLEKVIEEFEEVLNRNPDLAYSRVMCPRKLEPNTSYHAFLIPSYESGRLAGLGLEIPDTVKVDQAAWEGLNRPEGNSYPYYHKWEFSTGTLGDFEYLVRLLEAKPIDSRVGTRSMDVQRPGINVSGIENPDLDGVLRLGGALRVPIATMGTEDREDFEKYDQWDEVDYPLPFQKGLASFINLADDYQTMTSKEANVQYGLEILEEGDKDPLITAPLYGRWHALQQRLLKDREGASLPQNKNWIHQLNLDPRYRVPAGFGTGVVQENQEDYMEAAWRQVGDILEANQKIRSGQFAKAAAEIWYEKHIGAILKDSPEKALQLMAPLSTRILYGGKTVHQTLKESKVSPLFLLPEMRKVLHAKGELMKRMYPDGATTEEQAIIEKLNNGTITSAPPKTTPKETPTVQDIADDIRANEESEPAGFLYKIAKKHAKLKWVFILIAFLFFALSIASNSFLKLVFFVIGFLFAYLYYLINRMKEKLSAELFEEANLGPNLVDEMHNSPDFEIADTMTPPTFGETDSAEATRFKEAFRDNLILIATSRDLAKEKPRHAIDINKMAETMYEAIDPKVTIPKLIYNLILIPERIKSQMPENFVEAMVYPEIDIPMYVPLKDISSELFLPNIQYVANNSISLLETNQKFIESYMMGLNHEFSKELLWREYPTDQRGSYFRQFWDASSFMHTDKNLTEEEIKERVRDITPHHLWSKASSLGDHDNKKPKNGEAKEEVVLVIRGEILKKYPTAVVYAHKAKWQLKNGQPDFTKARLLADKESENNGPIEDYIKSPLYEAKVDPDISFFGFNLTIEEVRGSTGDGGSDAGWFFIIKERPGEPQFGLDIDGKNISDLETWADLSWKKVAPNSEFLEINNQTPTIKVPFHDFGENTMLKTQNLEDQKIEWSENMNAAELAYILYQAPVMIAVHANEMLPKN